MGFVATTTLRTAVAAWALGGTYALYTFATSAHVREFQAVGAEPAGLGERVNAWFQRTSVETVGFALVALIIASTAALLGRGDRRLRRGWVWILAGSLWAWVRHGAYYAEELIPFLSPTQLVILTALGWGAPSIGVAVLTRLSILLPTGRASFAGAAVVAGPTVLVGSELWRVAVREGGGLASLASVGTLAAVGLALLVVPGLLGRAADTADGSVAGAAGDDASSGSDTRTTRSLPRPLLVAVAATVLVGALLRVTAPAPPTPTYAQLESTRSTDRDPSDERPRHVLFVVIDTLRADALGCYGYERPTSPRMDALAEAGTVFEDVSSPAPWTKPSTASLLTGLWPSRHGALKHGSKLRTPDELPTLAETFRDAGFATAGFVSNPNVKADFDFDRGFQEFFDRPVDDSVPNATIRDSVFGRLLIAVTRYQFNWKYANDIFAMNRHVEAWLRANKDQDFFLYVHYIDPHTPYSPPARWRREFTRSHGGFPLHTERRALVGRDLYDGEVRTSDEGMGNVFDLLEELGIADDTLTVITSDHGEEFNEKGMFEHGYSLYQAEVFVPLIFHGPGVEAQRVDMPVSTTQVAATLLEVAGVAAGTPSEPYVFGDAASLAHVLAGETSGDTPMNFLENEFNMSQAPTPDFVHEGIREGSWKLVLTRKSRFRPIDRFDFEELYDLAVDPGEENNLFHDAAQEDRVERMMQRLSAHRTFLEAKGLRGGEVREMTAEEIEMLKQLGYLTDEE